MDKMRISLGVVALAAMFALGTIMSYAAEPSMSEEQGGQMQPGDITGSGEQQKHDSELGLEKGQDDNFGGMPKEQRRGMESGPMGEETKGGAGPSGPKGVPPGPAPQFEGSGQQKPGQSPTGGQ
jgi:hypothetical protein